MSGVAFGSGTHADLSACPVGAIEQLTGNWRCHMQSRRIFLKTGLSLCVLPTTLHIAAASGMSLPARALTFSENACCDSRLFTEVMSAERLNVDPSAHLLELDAVLSSGDYDTIFGLTRASNHFLIKQYAEAHQLARVYTGIHKYDADALEHRLQGSSPVVNYLTELLRASPHAWPQMLAESASIIARSGSVGDVSKTIRVLTRRPNDSPGYLVSWMMEKRA